jgi:hypothetical protein
MLWFVSLGMDLSLYYRIVIKALTASDFLVWIVKQSLFNPPPPSFLFS